MPLDQWCWREQRIYHNDHCEKRFSTQCFLSAHQEVIKLREQLAKSSKKRKKAKHVVILEEEEIDEALRYLYEKATKEVEQFCPLKLWKDTMKIQNIRFWTSRVLPSQEFTVGIQLSEAMLDLSPTMYCVPLVDEYSPLAWSIVLQVHWEHPTAKHAGVPTVVRHCNGLAHIFNCAQVAQVVKENCARCKYIKKRTIQLEFGPLSRNQLHIAPPYYVTMCDLFGPFKAFSLTNARQTFKVWFCVYVCVATGCTSVQVMEDYSSASFVMGYTRFSSNNGHVKVLLVDEGKNIESGGKDMEIDWVNVQYQLHANQSVRVETCPVGDHHQHGKVERKVQQIKKTMEKTMTGARLSALSWQTLSDSVSNTINNLPIARNVSSMSGVMEDVGSLDLITPNRLRFGKNNDRAPVGPAFITNDPKKVIDSNLRIFEAWWQNWIDVALPKLMHKPQGTHGDRNLEVGDVVLLLKQEGALAGHYQFGMVVKVVESEDNIVRKVEVKYRNWTEQVDRSSIRSVNNLVLIRRDDELDIWEELFDASNIADLKFMIDSV